MPSAITLPHPSAPRLDTHPRASMALRTRVLASRGSLDRAIAAGRRSDTDALTLRARQLTAAPCREQIARGIERAIDRAKQDPPRMPSSAAPIQRAEVRQSEGRLRELVEELLSDRPVSARGVARASELITDVGSPVFSYHKPGTLSQRVSEIVLALNERS
jgi:hypothetical protein